MNYKNRFAARCNHSASNIAPCDHCVISPADSSSSEEKKSWFSNWFYCKFLFSYARAIKSIPYKSLRLLIYDFCFVVLRWRKRRKKNYENKMCTSRKINEISAREHNLIGYLLHANEENFQKTSAHHRFCSIAIRIQHSNWIYQRSVCERTSWVNSTTMHFMGSACVQRCNIGKQQQQPTSVLFNSLQAIIVCNENCEGAFRSKCTRN